MRPMNHVVCVGQDVYLNVYCFLQIASTYVPLALESEMR